MQSVSMQRKDPAPSRWAYRLERLRLTPGFFRLLRVAFMVFFAALILLILALNPKLQEKLQSAVDDFQHRFETRPEFMVSMLAVEGAQGALVADIREAFPADLPVSSFHIDLDKIRLSIEQMAAVKSASIRFLPDGVLLVDIVERQPVALWRNFEGVFALDEEGVVVAELSARGEAPHLPLLAGRGAEAHVAEALDLLQAASPLADRIRGLVRVGERRWDFVLTRGQKLLLPQKEPLQALELAILWNQNSDLFERDLQVVDMRLVERPTLRMSAYATEEFQRITKINSSE